MAIISCNTVDHRLDNFIITSHSIMGYLLAYSLPLAWVAAQPEKMRTSKYLSMLEGRGGHLRTVEEHARYLAGEEEHPPSHGHGGGH